MDATSLQLSARIALVAAGAFLIVAILAGGWKYAHIHRNAEAGAPVYVNVAHQAALAYAFSTLVVAALAQFSSWPDWINVVAVAVTLSQFALATSVYIIHGFDRTMTNQFQRPHRMGKRALPAKLLAASMIALFVCELSCVSVLFAGVVSAMSANAGGG